MRLFTKLIGSLALSFSLSACATQSFTQSELKSSDNSTTVEKFALICTGAAVRNKREGVLHPIDKNAAWISTKRVYNQLLKLDYEPQHIFVLYADSKPPFEGTSDEEKIKNEFKGSYNNFATLTNLEATLNGLEDKIGPEDFCTIYINQHGSSWGTAHFDYDGSFITGPGLTKILEGNKSKNILLVHGTCYAEKFTENVNIDGIIIAGSKRDVLGWIDRDFSFGQYFFEEMNNAKNDTNKDGKVSPYEALSSTKKRCVQYRAKIDNFLKTVYPQVPFDLSTMDLVPVYRKGTKQ